MNNPSNELAPIDRLQKIASWREKYGIGHNVMIPAEEAELMARELLAYREAQGKAVTLPEHMPYLSEETLANIINQDQEGSVANAARMLAKEVKFWHEKPLYAAPQLPAVPDERAEFESFMSERFGDLINIRRAKNGDQGYMAWDVVVAWIVWQRRAMLAAAPNPEVE